MKYIVFTLIFLVGCNLNKTDYVPTIQENSQDRIKYCETIKYNIREFNRSDKDFENNLVVDLNNFGFIQYYDCGKKFDEYLKKHYNIRSYLSGDTLFNRCNKEISDSLIEVKYGKGAVKRITFEALKYAITHCDNTKKDY
jgi:hypothetical protein